MSAAKVHVNALSLESCSSSKKCSDCDEIRTPGFNWLVVTCGCGCDEKRRTCENCPAGAPPKCYGIKYSCLNKD